MFPRPRKASWEVSTTYPQGMFMACPPSPRALSVERGSRMKPLYLAFSLAPVRPKLLGKKEKKSLELGLIGLVLVQNTIRHTNHHNSAWEREGAPMFG